MKKPEASGGSMDGLKVFAKFLVNSFALGPNNATRFSVVSFQSNATTRVGWSTDQVEINTAIDKMEAGGGTSISAGFEAAVPLLNNSRAGATQIVLLFSDGKQDYDHGGSNAAIASADLVKESGVTVFAWGMGENVDKSAMEKIATDASKALFINEIGELSNYTKDLEAAVCNVSPPPPPPMPAPPPPPCVDEDPIFCANTDTGPDGGVGTDELKVERCKSEPWETQCQVSCGKCHMPPSSPAPLPPSD